MLFVKGTEITFKYSDQPTDLLNKVNFRIDPESRIGLVGNNGSGKTTLLKVIMNELSPSTGHLQKFAGLTVGYLAQIIVRPTQSVEDNLWSSHPRLDLLRQKVSQAGAVALDSAWVRLAEFDEAGGYEFEAKITRHLDEFGFSKRVLTQTMGQLSGGESTKVNLIRVLLTDPNLLIFDEPTNNLDLAGVQWLKNYLKNQELPYILVSHDRALLDAVTTETWELEQGQLNRYSGNYSWLQQYKQQKYRSDMDLYEGQQKKIKALQLAAAQRRVDANRMENFKFKRAVKNNGGICKKDEGSGSMRAKPDRKMKSAKAVEKRIEIMIAREEAKRPMFKKKRKVSLFSHAECCSKYVVRSHGLSFKYFDEPVFSDISFAVAPGERLAIVGPNGCGKSSLLRVLHKLVSPTEGELVWAPSAVRAYFSQDAREGNAERAVLEVIEQKGEVDHCLARTVLGSLGVGTPLIQRKLKDLSSGEQVKVALAQVVLSGANTLLLDEPTNHLETQGQEALEQALMTYSGTVIFASHDIEFIKNVSSQIYDLSSRVTYRSFEEWRDSLEISKSGEGF